MRRILTSAVLACSLFGIVGVAGASPRSVREPVREAGHGPVVRGTVRGTVRGGEVRGTVRGGEVRGTVRGGDRYEGHERYENREGREIHYRDYASRPERRYERFDVRAGYTWNAGDWQWDGYEWIWVPGYYVRVIL